MHPLQPYSDIVDKLRNYSLTINWLDYQLPYEQILAWATIAVIGSLAWWMAKYIVKNM